MFRAQHGRKVQATFSEASLDLLRARRTRLGAKEPILSYWIGVKWLGRNGRQLLHQYVGYRSSGMRALMSVTQALIQKSRASARKE
jgi:hypothetical protein